MGIRFWRRIRIAPGVTLNLSKTSASLSFGPRGAKFTIGPHGRRTTIGATGTGLFYTKVHSKKGKGGGSGSSRQRQQQQRQQRDPFAALELGFMQRLSLSEAEKALVSGLRELVGGNELDALKHFEGATSLADAAYLAAVISLNNNRLDNAKEYFLMAEAGHGELRQYFDKYEVSAVMTLGITDEVSVKIEPDHKGVVLGLVEVYQLQGAWRDALERLQQLQNDHPDDVVVKLSLAELLMDALPNDSNASKKVVALAEGVENDTDAHAALLLYKGKALRQLGVTTAARDTLTTALRRKKDRSDELLRYIRYERALTYADLGQQARARSEFEKLYAESPSFEDVATKLNL